MTQKKQVSLAEMKVGIFVTIALILLAALILQRSWGISWLEEKEKVITYLPDVGGLKAGAPVWLAGIEIGKVRSVTIVPPEIYAANAGVFRQIDALKREIQAVDPTQANTKSVIADLYDKIRDLKADLRFVEVKMDISKDFLNRISTDSEVTIESKGLIGDSFIEISAGTFGVLPAKRGEHYVIEGVRRTGFREIMTGANDVVANFGVLSEQFKDIALKINPQKVGSGLTDTVENMQKTLRQANTTFAEATRLVKELRQGEGTFGRIVSDPALYNRLSTALDRFNSLAQEMQSGSGTLGRLVQDPQLFDNTNSALKRADVMMERIQKGEGTIGKLSQDPALYDTSRKAMERFAGLVEQIERGEGTLGKLLKDPSLYNNLNQSTSEMTKFIYDLRQDPRKYLTIRFRVF
jgi:phospholipid/cholesterol/gamma-HCH transport system substrate-binding protein